MSPSIETLTAEIRAFRDARDWLQFHNPKELAVAITAEAGELLQHFVWQSPEQSVRRVTERRAEIASEMADVAILLLKWRTTAASTSRPPCGPNWPATKNVTRSPRPAGRTPNTTNCERRPRHAPPPPSALRGKKSPAI